MLRAGQPRDRGSIPESGKVSTPKASRLAVGPNGTLYTGLKQPGLKINPSCTSDTEIKNVGSYTLIHPAWCLKMQEQVYLCRVLTVSKQITKTCDYHVKSKHKFFNFMTNSTETTLKNVTL